MAMVTTPAVAITPPPSAFVLVELAICCVAADVDKPCVFVMKAPTPRRKTGMLVLGNMVMNNMVLGRGIVADHLFCRQMKFVWKLEMFCWKKVSFAGTA
jgi:hypothetical protein